jgi:hypothetical protein
MTGAFREATHPQRPSAIKVIKTARAIALLPEVVLIVEEYS